MSSANVPTGASSSTAEVPLTNGIHGGTASRSEATIQAESLNTGAPSPLKVFVLSYNATEFMHNETTDYITLPGRQRLIRIEDEPKGLLGVYTSKTRAKTQGRRWLYLQLSGLADQPYLPLPYSRDNEDDRPLPGTWSRTGWINDKYTILDKGRYHDEYGNDFEDVSLSVTIEERYLDAFDDGQGYETEM